MKVDNTVGGVASESKAARSIRNASARYTKEFTVEAVRLLEQGEKSGGQRALELGVARNQRYKWQEDKKKGKDLLISNCKQRSDQENKSVRSQ